MLRTHGDQAETVQKATEEEMKGDTSTFSAIYNYVAPHVINVWIGPSSVLHARYWSVLSS